MPLPGSAYVDMFHLSSVSVPMMPESDDIFVQPMYDYKGELSEVSVWWWKEVKYNIILL